VSKSGICNLAPFSFFMAGGATPPSVIFSPVSGRAGSSTDTLRNVAATGEYVINVVSYAMRVGMNQACFAYPPEESEWPHSGFTAVPSRTVAPPRVAESPMALECRLHTIVPHGEGPLSANYVIGEVLCFHIAACLLDERGEVDARRVDYINRMGADWYSRATPEAMFELKRPEKG